MIYDLNTFKNEAKLAVVISMISLAFLLMSRSASAQDNEDVPADFILPSIFELDSRMALSNVDDSEFISLSNFEGFNADHPTIVKVLFRLANIQAQVMESFAQPIGKDTIEQMIDEPEEYRIKVFEFDGIVNQVEKHELLPRTAEGFGFDHYYIYSMTTSSGENVKVLSQHKPRPWPLGGNLKLSARVTAYFLQVCNQRPNQQMVFAADRLQWFPNEPNEQFNIGDGQLVLSAMNCDIADFDFVRAQHDMAIGGADGRVLSNWLQACGKLDPELAARVNWRKLDLVDLLSNPTKRTGEAVSVRGLARRISRVETTDQAGNKLVYYQIDMFYDLNDLEIDYTNRSRNTRKFRNSFPITVCTTRLPAGVEPGPDLKIPLEIRGFFFKLWSFQTDQTKEISEENRQTNPLFVATIVEIDESVASGAWPIKAYSFVVLFGVLLICGGMIAWHHLGKYRSSLTPLKSRKNAEGQSEEKVDFSALK